MITFNPLKSISLNNNHLNFRSIIFSLILSLVISTITFSASNYNPRMNNQKDLLFSSPSEWIICGPNSWEELKNYLPEAKMSGVTIKVVILPPFQSTNICTEGSYSEPFQNNYIRWAQEIAKLSLRYSNIVQYEIYQLRENLNLGYLRSSYIDSIITVSNSINPKLQFITLNAPNYKIWYVDKDATGTSNGTSWTNASTSLAGLPWASIEGGDSVYISGGSDSISYGKDSIWIKSFNEPVIITKGKDSNHNGKVIFSSRTVGGTKSSFFLESCNNIKLTGLSFKWELNASGYATLELHNGGGYNQIDNCHIVSNGHCPPLYLDETDHTSITNNIIETLANNYTDEQDALSISAGSGGHIIIGNSMIIRGGNSLVHRDIIQINDEGSVNNYETIIANNFLYVNVNGTAGTDAIRLGPNHSNRFLIYNNVISVKEDEWVGIALFETDASYNISARIFNNTIYNGDVNGMGIRVGTIDTLIMKNNIVLMDSSSGPGREVLHFDGIGGLASITYKDIDYNIYNRPRSTVTVQIGDGGPAKTWAAWQELGYDIHGSIAPISFGNKFGTRIIDYISNKSNSGIDLSAYFIRDILGVVRPQVGVWDIGALEQ